MSTNLIDTLNHEWDELTRRPTATDVRELVDAIEVVNDDDRDAIFVTLASRAADETLAARALRQAVLPACAAMCAGRNDESLLAAAIDAAYAEVMSWAGNGQAFAATTKAA